MDRNARLPRRQFLKHTASLGAGVAAGLAPGSASGASVARRMEAKPPAKPPLERRNEQPGLLYKRLGRTNMRLSALSFGGVQITPETMPVFEAGVQRGMNFVMAHSGRSAKVFGSWLKKKGSRQKIFLGLQGTPRRLDQELRLLNTDCVDLLMVANHNPQSVKSDELRKQFEAAKKAGKARHLCLVFHSNLPAVWAAGVEAGWYDVLLSTYSLPSRADLKPLIPDAAKKDIGLLTMKVSRGTRKEADAIAAGKTVLADGIASVLRTLRTPEQLAQWLRLARQDDKAPPAKVAQLDMTGQCTLCGACAPCPGSVAIQDILRTYQYYAGDLNDMEEAFRQYAAIPLEALASSCTDCGRCELACPQELPIRRLIREAHFELELELVHRHKPPRLPPRG